ncbi:DsrE family protein [Streptomyces sp. H39-S7]|uniref:DsrE family protein n=1 Tax=Streptomyces sp. H39-S7 TaxID=3004357 RepID=UPI0022AF27CC|nr:DsrE family protein [Streptomyces sp. H39-S7]MCZ4123112.1 DsrE family protein [Streptomyces sp. H39-S7]
MDTRPALAPHLLMESKGPWTGPSCAAFLRDARDLARIGHPVQLLLIQDGVGAAVRDPSASAGTREVAEAGGEIWVDDFSLAQRGLSDSDLLPSARVVGMSEVSARVLDPAVKVVWH